ncbi:unnamed protein product [Orchesella dallaii]|uniref:Nanos-type domain-containing protein n=1 Tax=Orchesella dallaii TaxID=48710 RepID=A0ABP1Q8A3_9HEXA
MMIASVSSSPMPIPLANMVGEMAHLLLNQQSPRFQTPQQCTNPQYFYVPLDSPTPGTFYLVNPMESHAPPVIPTNFSPNGRFYFASSASSPPPTFQGGNPCMYAGPGIAVTIFSSGSSTETLGHSYAWSGWATSFPAIDYSGQLGQYYESYQSQRHHVGNNADRYSVIYSGSCSQSSFTPNDPGSVDFGFVSSGELQRTQFNPDINGFCVTTASFNSLGREDESVTGTGVFGTVQPPHLRRSQSCVQPVKPHCKFCKRNGETRQFYETHILGNKNQIQCPILRKYVCPVCNATGEKAHTLRYCPANRDASGRMMCSGRFPKSGRTSTGIRNRYVTV